MITETRQSRTRHLQYERHRRQHHQHHHHRRHHTLDNATLDKFNFICVPLHRDESRIDSSSSHTNLTMTQPTSFSHTSIRQPPTTISTITSTRRVRFKFDENDKNQYKIDLNNNRHSRSSDDVRLPHKNCIHRVEFKIPIHQDINPWLNVDCSTTSSIPAKTRSLTSQKIDIKQTNNNNSMRVQAIAPFVQAEITSPTSSTNDSDKNQSQWYRQMYGHLHKSSDNKQDHQQNPYKPTYIFPEDFNGDFDHMEDYIRKTATQTVDRDYRKFPTSQIRPLTSSLKDPRAVSKRTNGHVEKVTRFEEHYSSPVTSPPVERSNTNNDAFVNNNSRFNSNHLSSSSDNEQKLVYKRILRGGDIPSNGLQKLPNNNIRGKNIKNYLHIYSNKSDKSN